MSKLFRIILWVVFAGLIAIVVCVAYNVVNEKVVNFANAYDSPCATAPLPHKPFPDCLGVGPLSKNISAEVRMQLQEYKNKIYKVPTSLEQCTMVIQTYKRVEILPRVISHYCTMVIFHKVLIIWNDVNTAVPASLIKSAKMCQVKVEFIFPKENRLTNKFVPRKEIETDCVCLSDDDRIVQASDVTFGFDVWQNFRHRLVGFEERSVIPGPNHTFRYAFHQRKSSYVASSDGWSKSYSIMLMTACFVHKANLKMYFDPDMNSMSVLDYVNKQKNCEDILLSVLVTKFLQDIGHSQCGVVMVMAKQPIKNLDEDKSLKGRMGLRMRKNHYKDRSLCLNKFAEIFGFLPLKTSRIGIIET